MAKTRVEYEIRAKDKSRKATQEAEKNVKDLGAELKSFKKTVGAAFGVASVAAFGKMVVDVTGDLIQAYGQQERAELQLQAAIKNNPYMDGSAARRIGDFASELQNVTTVGDEVTLSMASMLASTGRTEDQIRDVVTVAADLSAGLGISLESAVRNLNKTFGGTTGELGELIPSLKDLSAEQLRNGEAVEMLAGQFDGLAEQMRNSTLGELEAFKNTWGDLKENTGEIIAGFFNPIIQKLDDMAQAAIDASESIELLRGGKAGGSGGLSEIDKLRLELEALEESRAVVSQTLSNLENSPADFTGRERLIEQQEQELADLNRAIGAVSTKINLFSDLQDDINRGQAGSSGGDSGGGLTPDQIFLAEIKAALEGQIQQNYRMEDVMEGIGDDFDLFGANNTAVKDALQELVQNGFTMNGSGIQSIVSEFGEYLTNPEDMYNAIIDGFNGTADRFRDMFARGEGSEGESAAEESEEAAKATSQLQAGLMGLIQNMKQSIGPAQIWQEIFSQFGQVLNFVAKLANPLVTIFLGMAQVLAPLMEQLLAPLVGILMVVGQVIGNLLAPALLVLKPIIETIANIFLAFYNSVIVPVNNAIQSFFTEIINAVIKMFRKAIKAINKIPGVDIKKPKYIDDDRGHLKKLSLPELAGAGYGDFNVVPPSDLWNMNPINMPESPETPDSPSRSGRAANYSQGRDVTVNVQINTEVIAGDPGIRQLALMIRDEIFAAEALGI